MQKGFTLVEMLVVIGIIAVLTAASMAGYSSMTKTAEKTRAQELVSNVVTALTAIYQEDGVWPKRLISGMQGESRLDAETCKPLNRFMPLNGYDKFGIVTPWAVTVIKQKGNRATLQTAVGSKKIEDHILRFAIDEDGDGITELPNSYIEGGVKVRATACVWCCSKEGSFKAKDIIKSWSKGQEVR